MVKDLQARTVASSGTQKEFIKVDKGESGSGEFEEQGTTLSAMERYLDFISQAISFMLFY